MKKIFALILTLVMAMSLVACGGGKKEEAPAAPAVDDTVYELSWAGISATDAVDTWIGEEIAARVAEATNDKVQIKVYPANQLGDLSQAYDEIINGSIDMGLFTIYGTYDIIQEAVYTPFLTTNYEAFEEVYGREGFLYKALDEAQASRGVKLLGFWPSGYLGLGFAKLTTSTDDLFDCTAKKNELLRVPGMDTMMASAQAMGFNTTTIGYSDVYTALQTGVCDASWNGGAYSNYQAFRDVLKYFVDYRVCNDVYSCVMNADKLASLPQEYQDAIMSISEEVIAEGTAKIAEMDSAALEDMKEYGIEVIVPTDEQRASMNDFFFENVLPGFSQYYGEDFMNQLVEAAKAAA